MIAIFAEQLAQKAPTDWGSEPSLGPVACLDGVEEIGNHAVEQSWLLKVYRVAALREDDEAAVRDAALHEDRRLEARFVLIAGQDECRHLERLHFQLPIEERWTAGLDTSHGVGRSRG